MKNKKYFFGKNKIVLNSLLGVTILIIVLFLLFLKGSLKPKSSNLMLSDYEPIHSGWEELTESGEWKSIDFSYQNTLRVKKDTVIRYRLPEHLKNGQSICLQSQNTPIDAYIGNNLIYSSGTIKDMAVGKFFGVEWIAIDIPDNMQGQYLIIALEAALNAYIAYPLITPHDAIIARVIVNSIPSLLIYLTLILLGIVEIIHFLYLKNGNRQNKADLFYGMFVIMTSIWLMTDSIAFNLIVENRYFGFYISVLSFFCTIPLFLLFLREHLQTNVNLINHLLAISCVNIILIIVISVSGLVDISTLVIIPHLEILMTILLTLRISFKRRKEAKYRNVFCAVLVFAGFLILSIVLFYFSSKNFISRIWYGMSAQIGLVLFCCILAWGRLNEVVRAMQLAKEATYYKTLAFSDHLTRLRNFAAYQSTLELFNNTREAVAVIMFDLNNLKAVNDSMGHIAGDELISTTASCIREAFIDCENVFRIGGDEFIVLLNEMEKLQSAADAGLIKFEDAIAAHNNSSDIKISVAYGYAIREKGDTINLQNVIFAAEEKMYQNKKRMKRQYLFEGKK